MPTPLVIHLYDADNEPRQFVQGHVPWSVLKSAVRLGKDLNLNALGEADIDRLGAFVVEVFGNRFTLEELNAGADVSEVAAVLQQVVAKAGLTAEGNPTRGG